MPNIKNKNNRKLRNTLKRKNKNTRNKNTRNKKNTKRNQKGGSNQNKLRTELRRLTNKSKQSYNTTGVAKYNPNRNERIKALRTQLGLPIGINLRVNSINSPMKYTRKPSGTWMRNNRHAPNPEMPEYNKGVLPGTVQSRARKMNKRVKSSKTPQVHPRIPPPKITFQEGDVTSGVAYPGQTMEWVNMMNPNKAGKIYLGKRRVRRHRENIKAIQTPKSNSKYAIVRNSNIVRQKVYPKNHGEDIHIKLPITLRPGNLPSQMSTIEALSREAESTGLSPSNIATKEKQKMAKYKANQAEAQRQSKKAAPNVKETVKTKAIGLRKMKAKLLPIILGDKLVIGENLEI